MCVVKYDAATSLPLPELHFLQLSKPRKGQLTVSLLGGAMNSIGACKDWKVDSDLIQLVRVRSWTDARELIPGLHSLILVMTGCSSIRCMRAYSQSPFSDLSHGCQRACCSASEAKPFVLQKPMLAITKSQSIWSISLINNSQINLSNLIAMKTPNLIDVINNY